MPDLVEGCLVRARDEIGRGAERQQVERRVRERRDGAVLEGRHVEVVLRERDPSHRRERLDLGDDGGGQRRAPVRARRGRCDEEVVSVAERTALVVAAGARLEGVAARAGVLGLHVLGALADEARDRAHPLGVDPRELWHLDRLRAVGEGLVGLVGLALRGDAEARAADAAALEALVVGGEERRLLVGRVRRGGLLLLLLRGVLGRVVVLAAPRGRERAGQDQRRDQARAEEIGEGHGSPRTIGALHPS
ncbi:MAG: hypothetical protein IPJ34_41405 [Myxococcales bacterium]|nr:hypothetical protein [Myxococcales bacterium]